MKHTDIITPELLEVKRLLKGKESALDDTVHDLKSKEASAINNEGTDAQLEYLLESGMTLEAIKKELTD